MNHEVVGWVVRALGAGIWPPHRRVAHRAAHRTPLAIA